MTFKSFKFLIVPVFILSLSLLAGCDFIGDDGPGADRTSLRIDGPGDSYSLESISPGFGRYYYDRGATAEIEFEIFDGYEFESWDGPDGYRVTRKDLGDNKYKSLIHMDEDRRIKLGVNFKEFLLLAVEFTDREEKTQSVKIDDLDKPIEVAGIPHNLETIFLKFNNIVDSDNKIEGILYGLLIEEDEDNNDDNDNGNNNDNNEEKESFDLYRHIKLEENHVEIEIFDWLKELARAAEDEENSREEIYEKKYDMTISTKDRDNIFTVNNYNLNINGKETDGDIKFQLEIDKPYPEPPYNLHFESDERLTWRHKRPVAGFDLENDHEMKYRIEVSKNNRNDFKELVTVEGKENTIIVKHGNFDLENNLYYARVIAINDYDVESDPSKIISFGNK